MNDFLEDEKTQHAVLHCIEIIGEAASRLSEVTRVELDNLPWDGIKGLRNRIAHEYFAVNLEIIWDVTTEHLPILHQVLEDVVPREAM